MKIFLLFVVALLSRTERLVLDPPLGLDLYMPVPQDNTLTVEKVEMGRRLFFDTTLSSDRRLACASCHDPDLAFSDGRAVARGNEGAESTRKRAGTRRGAQAPPLQGEGRRLSTRIRNRAVVFWCLVAVAMVGVTMTYVSAPAEARRVERARPCQARCNDILRAEITTCRQLSLSTASLLQCMTLAHVKHRDCTAQCVSH